MTVRDLINKLSVLDLDKEVYLEVDTKLHYLAGPAIGINTDTAVDTVVYIEAVGLDD